MGLRCVVRSRVSMEWFRCRRHEAVAHEAMAHEAADTEVALAAEAAEETA